MSQQDDLQNASGMPPSAILMQMIRGAVVSQAIYVAAKLGIADLLNDGPKRSDELTQITATHAPSLYRVLRLLAALGVFAEIEEGRFGLTPLSECLQTLVPGSVRAWALMTETSGGLAPLENILYSVKTGEPAFDHLYGMGLFQYQAQHPKDDAGFNAAMTERTAAVATTVAAVYNFSGMRTVVDVGGGYGIFMVTILKAYPVLHGVVFDQPHVVAGAQALLETAGVANRCEIMAGDFFATVPGGGDAYVLSNILHDWNDKRAVKILTNCRQVMAENGRVLVVDGLISEDARHSLLALTTDLAMLVITGGRERTEAEYGQLFAAAGLRLTKVIPVLFPDCVIEGVPA